MSDKTIIAIKVHFELITSNKLRKIVFGLEKDTKDDVETWTIDFQLFEREKPTEDFGAAIVKFDVEVDEKLNSKAEKIADADKLSTPQKAHLRGPAVTAAKAAKAGQLPQAQADKTVADTLKV